MRCTVPFPFDFVLPFLISPGYTFAIFPTRRRGEFDSVLPTRSDFYEVFLPILPFPLSLFSLPSSHLPASFCNPSDPGRYPSAGIRNERTREKTNFESRCLKGRKSSGRRGAKGRKNIPESSVKSTNIHRFQMISSLSIFYHRKAWFLERNSLRNANSYNITVIKEGKRIRASWILEIEILR